MFLEKVGDRENFDAEAFYDFVRAALRKTNEIFPYEYSAAFRTASKNLLKAYQQDWLRKDHTLQYNCYLTKEISLNGKTVTAVRMCLLQLSPPAPSSSDVPAPPATLYFAVYATESLKNPDKKTVWKPLVEQGCWKLYNVPKDIAGWNKLTKAALDASARDHVQGAVYLVEHLDRVHPYNERMTTGDPRHRLLNSREVTYRPAVPAGWHVRRKVKWLLKAGQNSDVLVRCAASSVRYVLGPSGSGKTDTLLQVLHMLAHQGDQGHVVGLYFLAEEIIRGIEYDTRGEGPATWTSHIANNVADVIHSKLESLKSVPQDSTWDLSNLHLVLLFDEVPGNSDFGKWLFHSGNQITNTSHPLCAEIAKVLHAKKMKNSEEGQYATINNLRVTTLGAGVAVNALPDEKSPGQVTRLPGDTVLATMDDSTGTTTAELIFDTFVSETLQDRQNLEFEAADDAKRQLRSRQEMIAAAKAVPLLSSLMTNARCAAVLGGLVAQRYTARLGTLRSFHELVVEDAPLLAEQTALHFVRWNAWGSLHEQVQQHYARLLLSLTQTVPKHYTLVSDVAMRNLEMTLGAVEDCADAVVDDQLASVKLSDHEQQHPLDAPKEIPWARSCFPRTVSTGVVIHWHVHHERAVNKMRYRIEPAMLYICLVLLKGGRSLFPSWTIGSPLKHEEFVLIMTHTMLYVHAEAARQFLGKTTNDNGSGIQSGATAVVPSAQQEQQPTKSVHITHLLPWLRNDDDGPAGPHSPPPPTACTIFFTPTTCVKRVDNRDPSDWDPCQESEAIGKALDEGHIVVEGGVGNAAQCDVIVHTRWWTLGLECKAFHKGGYVDAKKLFKRALAMDYNSITICGSFAKKKVPLDIAKKTEPLLDKTLVDVDNGGNETKKPEDTEVVLDSMLPVDSSDMAKKALRSFFLSIKDRLLLKPTYYAQMQREMWKPNKFTITEGTFELTLFRESTIPSAMLSRRLRARMLSKRCHTLLDHVFLVGSQHDKLLPPSMTVTFTDPSRSLAEPCGVSTTWLSISDTLCRLAPSKDQAKKDTDEKKAINSPEATDVDDRIVIQSDKNDKGHFFYEQSDVPDGYKGPYAKTIHHRPESDAWYLQK